MMQDTLFALSVDPTQTHVLRVINLEDDRFNGASQITFDSLVLTLNGTERLLCIHGPR